MPAISTEDFVPWVNYHLSVGDPKGRDLEPQLQVERLGRVHASDLEGLGIERFAATAEMFWKHISIVKQLMHYKWQLNQLGNPAAPFPLAITGRGWSFNDLIGSRRGVPCPAMLNLEGLSSVVMIADQDRAPRFEKPVAMVGGGTRLREIAARVAPLGLSLTNSGTHLGMTIGGAIATASHGGRLGFGGLQNMVHGIHLVTGIGESVWIQRASQPVLTNAAASRLAPGKGKFVNSKDDAMFEDALVHLGCMGIVNAVAVELEPIQTFEEIRIDRQIDASWLDTLSNGDWPTVAKMFNKDADPDFYELTIKPDEWDGPSALHMAYFKTNNAPDEKCQAVTFADAVADIGNRAMLQDPTTIKTSFRKALIGRPVPIGLLLGTSEAQSVFEHYANTGTFTPHGSHFNGTWDCLHGDEITGGYPGSLWNASYAIDRAHLAAAIPAICAATKDLPNSFVFTVRFVSGAAGSMAFTRFKETAVIEIDGLSPWICEKVKQRWINFYGGEEGLENTIELLTAIERVLPLGAMRVAQALRDAEIDYSSHWAKLGTITPDDTHAAFGDPTVSTTKLGRWHATREKLLSSDFAKAIFWNWGAVRMGVLDRPTTMPNLP